MTERTYGDYAISPLYGILDEHQAAVLFVMILLAAGIAIRRWSPARSGPSLALIRRYRTLDRGGRVSVWLVAASAAAHLGLAVGHTGGWRLAFVAGFAGLSLAAYRLLLPGRTWFVAAVLIVSISAYAVVTMAGGTPDQVGVATKLTEILALTILTNSRRLFPILLPMAMVLLVSFASWVGAMRAGEGGHHAAQTPQPGVALPIVDDRSATDEQRRAAERLFEETRAAIAKYSDTELARADGYQVAGLSGRDFHADNPTYQADGRILDPLRPETLVYAATPSGPLLLGAMFQMPEVGQPGPAVGGPLTVWHAHDHVCLSLFPPSLAGLSDPFGVCPAGTVTLPITNEMIHVWVLPGLDEPFGDLPDTWLDDFLDAHA